MPTLFLRDEITLPQELEKSIEKSLYKQAFTAQANVAQLIGTLFHIPKDGRFDSQSEHMPKLQVGVHDKLYPNSTYHVEGGNLPMFIFLSPPSSL